MATTKTTTTHDHHPKSHGRQRSITNTGKKVLFAAALTIATTNLIGTEAFHPTLMTSPSSKLDYVVSGEDQATATATVDILGIENTKTIQTKTKTNNNNNNKNNYRHGYIVANHDHERSFWLHALQNLESSSASSPRQQSLWTRIACAYGPRELREACAGGNQQQDAVLVRVGDADLDIRLAVPCSEGSGEEEDPHRSNGALGTTNNVVSTTIEFSNRRRQQLVTIRVAFPEGSSFDKVAFTFEDELTAVIRQVRLLEQTANEKLSELQQQPQAA